MILLNDKKISNIKDNNDNLKSSYGLDKIINVELKKEKIKKQCINSNNKNINDNFNKIENLDKIINVELKNEDTKKQCKNSNYNEFNNSSENHYYNYSDHVKNKIDNFNRS